MNPGLDFTIDFESLTASHPVPASLAGRIRALCESLVNLYTGQTVNLPSMIQDLSSLAVWLKNRSQNGPDDPDWTAKVISLPGGAGGQLDFQDRARSMQALTLSLDGNMQPTAGIWQSLNPGEEDRAFTFQVERQGGQWTLVIDDGKQQRSQRLPETAANLGWGSIAAFSRQLFGLFTPRAEPPSESAQTLIQPAISPQKVSHPPSPQPANACPNCGATLPPTARFCNNCGFSVQPAPPAPAPPVPPPEAAPTWYYIDQGKRAGPIDDATIRRWVKERRLAPETMVWNASLSGRVEARRAGLFEQEPPAKPATTLKWYYVDNGAQAGPIDDTTFRKWFAERRLGPDTMVWNPALPGWIKASQAGLIHG